MALQGPVDPDKGIYVEMLGVMEVRWLDEAGGYCQDSVDMIHFQQRQQDIPDKFCKKDKTSKLQAVFHCLLCWTDSKDINGLCAHIKGKKHVKKYFQYKNDVLGTWMLEPENATKKKTTKRERPVVDLGLSLEKRLQASGLPALGLEYITEHLNPEDQTDIPLYTCSLCPGVWGNSDAMFHHVSNSMHYAKFLMKIEGFERISRLTRNQLLELAVKEEEKRGGPENRDYDVITKEADSEAYQDLWYRQSNRPEKRVRLE